jgi:hypothetical protein
LFKQIQSQDDVPRGKALHFLKEKVYPLRSELIHTNKEVEMAIAEGIKKASNDVTGEEFKFFVDFLSSLKIYENNTSDLLDLIADQANLQADFKPTDADNIERLISCANMALPFLKVKLKCSFANSLERRPCKYKVHEISCRQSCTFV